MHGGGDLDAGIPRCQLPLEPCRQRIGAHRRSTGGGERDDGGSDHGKRGGSPRRHGTGDYSATRRPDAPLTLYSRPCPDAPPFGDAGWPGGWGAATDVTPPYE